MKSETIVALVLSLIVIAISTLLILILEPSSKTVPYFHDKSVDEVENYIISMKNNENSNDLLFKNLKEVDEDTLKYVMGIEPGYLDGYSVMASTKDATTFLVLRFKTNSKALVETSVLEYMDYLEKKWEDIDKTQAELIQNYAKVTYDNYLIYAVSDNNEYFKNQINDLFIYTDK